MSKDRFEKTQEEIFKERADVLSRAGRSLSEALDRLSSIGKTIDRKRNLFNGELDKPASKTISRLMHDLNEDIYTYNQAREYAKLRYYYLIVTREALGLRKHKWVEDTYRIPPKIGKISGFDEQVQKTKSQDG